MNVTQKLIEIYHLPWYSLLSKVIIMGTFDLPEDLIDNMAAQFSREPRKYNFNESNVKEITKNVANAKETEAKQNK